VLFPYVLSANSCATLDGFKSPLERLVATSDRLAVMFSRRLVGLGADFVVLRRLGAGLTQFDSIDRTVSAEAAATRIVFLVWINSVRTERIRSQPQSVKTLEAKLFLDGLH
jgi:hypothetical protein